VNKPRRPSRPTPYDHDEPHSLVDAPKPKSKSAEAEAEARRLAVAAGATPRPAILVDAQGRVLHGRDLHALIRGAHGVTPTWRTRVGGESILTHLVLFGGAFALAYLVGRAWGKWRAATTPPRSAGAGGAPHLSLVPPPALPAWAMT
jgi:hypothetical protein